jgi:hypothetical protein
MHLQFCYAYVAFHCAQQTGRPDCPSVCFNVSDLTARKSRGSAVGVQTHWRTCRNAMASEILRHALPQQSRPPDNCPRFARAFAPCAAVACCPRHVGCELARSVRRCSEQARNLRWAPTWLRSRERRFGNPPRSHELATVRATARRAPHNALDFPRLRRTLARFPATRPLL